MDTERTIDSALAGYVEATPRAGLEQRVLKRIRNEQASRRRSRRLLGLAIGLAAALLFVIAGIRTGHSLVPASAPKTAELAGPPSIPRHPAPVRLREVRRRSGSKRRQHRVPALAPLTGEERALVSLVERFPEQTLLAFADIQRRSNEPVAITPIEIQPLPGSDRQ